ncbi:MAG: metal-dependent transcriptional regulator [Anaerolineales bacterium]|jgi:DtxR family Mn-dependent transcriptional regulator
MITEADQNYLKEIYGLELDHGQVTTSMLADRFGFSPATVTGMLKKLSHNGWVAYEPYQGVTLTDDGRKIALEVIRHHRLLETYLARALDIPWDRLHEEAEKLEHVLSDYLEARIDERLGYPTSDPHGSPIPALDGSISDAGRTRLANLAAGTQAEVVEVYDRDPELLARLEDLGLYPGTMIEVEAVEPLDGLLTIKVGGNPVIVGQTTASHVFVKQLDPHPAHS